MKTLAVALSALLFAGAGLAAEPAQVDTAPADHATAQEQELLDAFYPLTEHAGPLGMVFSTVIISDADKNDSPLELGFKDGVCTLYIEVRGNPNYDRMLATAGKYSRETKLRAMLTHEMGHCYRNFFQGAAGRGASAALAAPASAAGKASNDHDDEMTADLFALAWAAVYNPGEFDDVYAFLHELRFTLFPLDTSGLYASESELALGLKMRPTTGPLSPKALPRIALLFLDPVPGTKGAP